ncbi:hypothetical protein MNBD_GAMMA01-663 [hydrothermal vent metagenome]|uniref:Uncharacterized protein n=1 Tax=hydrothermal vent metagenome TaxID=652676 RepID=A0A3B0VCV2_9ZZZZ
MKKSNKGRGPLARKVINLAQQQLQRKVTNLSDLKNGKLRSKEYQKSIISEDSLSKLDPLHALYVYSQNHLSILIEQILDLPALAKLADMYVTAVDEYMPSRPPMSPLTTSYFTCWGSFDLCSFGAKRETLCSIATDFCTYINADNDQIEVFEVMQNSRMGIYKHEGVSGKYINFRELITNKTIKAVSASGYMGQIGEIWFARILPPLFHSFDYSVVFTTPYILGKLGSDISFVSLTEDDWLTYFTRNLDKIGLQNVAESYQELMKYGLNKNYWNEYIILSYKNHTDDMILLEGFPDIPTSMPHGQ